MANPIAEQFCRFTAAESWPLSDAGGHRFFTTEEPNHPADLVNSPQPGYKTYSAWSHVNLPGDKYSLESDETGSWTTIADDITDKSYLRVWEERMQANYRVRTKRGSSLSAPSNTALARTNTRVKGVFRDSATSTPQENVLIIVRRKDTGEIVASGYTAQDSDQNLRTFDIELDSNWPWTASVIAPDGKPESSINGGVASEVSV